MNIFKKCKVLRKIGFTLLITVFLAEIFTNCFVMEAHAASTSSVSIAGVSLPSDSDLANQMESLGLSSEEPVRYSASGKEIDKTKNPLGADNTVVNRTYQLAYTYRNSKDGKDMLNTYDSFGSGNVNLFQGPSSYTYSTSIAASASSASGSFSACHRCLAAVDTDGNGTQEVANVGYVISGNSIKLQLFISDYNSLVKSGSSTVPATSKIYTVAELKSYPGSNGLKYTNDSLKCTAGDFDHDGIDEIAIATDKSIYVCRATMTSFKVESTATGTAIEDIEALDSNGDCYPELLAVQWSGAYINLVIYNGTDVSKQAVTIPLSTGGVYFTTATVDIGDLLGDGDNTIVIGGRIRSGQSSFAGISYIKYHADTESYDKSLTKIYNMLSGSKTGFQAVNGDLQVKCVNLATKVEGTPEYVVLGGYIFQYDAANDIFTRQAIATYKEISDGVSENSAKKSEDNITDVNYTKDDTWILQTIVGNFDGNNEGKEQILMLHYNDWQGEDVVYVTQCVMKSDGTIASYLTEVSRDTEDSGLNYPSICPVDVYNHSTKMTFLPKLSYLEYSNPVIISVLGATPYYSELEDQTPMLGNVGTTFGTGTEEESSSSNGVTASVGVSFGFEQGLSVFGVQIIKTTFETEITNTFKASWGSSTSISKNISYTNYFTDDAVVLTVVPYDVYIYQSTAWNSSKKRYETGKVVVKIPYDMLTTMLTVEDYNKAAHDIKNAPLISSDVLKHTIGDPRTYPTASKGLSNVKDKGVLMNGSSDSSSLIGCGIGNSSIEQSITTSSSTSKSFDYELNVTVSSSVAVAGVSAGASVGAGYDTEVSFTSTKSTTRTGSVCSVPSGYGQYQFKWAMAAYNYNLELEEGNDTQEIFVINYICAPVSSSYPPKVPAGLSVSSQDLNYNLLKWNASDGASGYNVLRSTSQDGIYDTVAVLRGKSTNTYTDSTITAGQTYYYEIQAYNGAIAVPTAPLAANSLYVTDMQIKTQPKLSYSEYDKLDLTALIVSLVLSNQSTRQVSYGSFGDYSMITSLENGLELGADDSGTTITVKYTPANVSANTNALAVKSGGAYPVEMTVKFTVGSTSGATVLETGKQLTAAITMANKQSDTIQAVAVTALYNKYGTMVQCVSKNVSINAGSTANCSNSLTLPSDISGYTAKVFIWDGTSISSSGLTPLSEVVQIPD